MDRERIEEIIRIAQEAPILELTVRDGDLEVRVVKASPHPTASAPVPRDANLPTDTSASDQVIVVRADKVGFFHRGKGPGTPPLVEVGDSVHAGQTLATLEALRKLTDVTAPACGTVIRILADDGSAVEYGQPLIELRPKEGIEESGQV
ncbi:MAG: acetyl-CoA carboxylase biotin carboxyl carrier protein [Candidatus Zipacnadales bacterium]